VDEGESRSFFGERLLFICLVEPKPTIGLIPKRMLRIKAEIVLKHGFIVPSPNLDVRVHVY
jgi:hypothetical protein